MPKEPTPIVAKVGRYQIMKGDDGKFSVWNSDGPLEGPFETKEQAIEAAQRLLARPGRE